MASNILESADLTVSGTGAYQSVTLVNPSELLELAPAWQALAAGFGPTEQLEWGTSCLATLDAARPLRTVALSRDSQLVGLATLVLRRMRGLRRLALVGVNDLHEPADLLAADADALDRLVRLVVKRGQPLVIERMLADSPTVAALERACHGRAIFVRRAAANCPYIPLDKSWLEPESHLNSGRRSDLRRARRKAEQGGEVRFEILTPRPDEVEQLFQQATAVEAKSWKGDIGTALAHDERRARFFRHYLDQAATAGSLRISFMHIGDRPAAMQIAVEDQQGFWLLKIGYDADFASASPGLLLMRETIRHAAAAGLASYEFLGRAEAWTAVWTKQERATVAVRVYPLNPTGFSALAVDSLAAAGRKAPDVAGRTLGRIKSSLGQIPSVRRTALSRGPVPLFPAPDETKTGSPS